MSRTAPSKSNHDNIPDSTLSQLIGIVSDHSFKPKDILKLLREDETNRKCYYCGIEGINQYKMDIARLICNNCAGERGKEKIKSLLFGKLDRRELLSILVAGVLVKKGMDEKGIRDNLEILLQRCESLMKSINVPDTSSSSITKPDHLNEPLPDPLYDRKDADASSQQSKRGKIGAVSIESLKNKRAQLTEQAEQSYIGTGRSVGSNSSAGPAVKEPQMQQQIYNTGDPIQFISLDRPLSNYKYKGDADIGLISKQKSSETDSYNMMCYSNLRFVRQQRKSRTEIIKEKSKNVVDGLLARFKRNNI